MKILNMVPGISRSEERIYYIVRQKKCQEEIGFLRVNSFSYTFVNTLQIILVNVLPCKNIMNKLKILYLITIIEQIKNFDIHGGYLK